MLKKTKRKPAKVSDTKKQNDLLEGSLERFGRKSDVHGIFLIRQGLRARSEQFVALADTRDAAIQFCRHTLTPKLCRDNEKNSLHTMGRNNELLRVNQSSNLLLIKTLDFVRKEEGRTNANPLWFWNIAPVTIIKSHLFKK